jgi:hypothetical protein
VRLEIDSHNVVYVLRQGQRIDCGPHGLAVLDAFHQPRTMEDAVDLLRPRGAQEWMDLTGTILSMYRSGILTDASTSQDVSAAVDGGFADPMTHAIMLNDRARTSRFIEAIEGVVRPDDVVLDIGTGSGVLAIAAARAGAGRVYAIEAGDMARLARATFEANGVADRVTLVQGWSTSVDLPEHADVLVSEIIGEVPLGERILEVTLDARQRLLKDDARLIPSRLRVHAIPIAIPADLLATRRISPEAVERWRGWYGVDFSPLAEAASGTSHVLLLDPESVRELPRLAEPAVLADLELGAFQQVKVEGEATVTVETPGSLNGVALYFDAELAPSVTLSTDPEVSLQESSWRNPVWYYNEALDVEEGQEIRLAFSYRVPGRPNGVTFSPA